MRFEMSHKSKIEISVVYLCIELLIIIQFQTRSEMPVPQGNYGGGQPSCFDRMKMGFMMGMVVGMCSGLQNTISTNIYLNILYHDTIFTNICLNMLLLPGAIFGGFGALRMGMRGGELVQNVGKVMVQGGGTFGTFMSIGTAIRC